MLKYLLATSLLFNFSTSDLFAQDVQDEVESVYISEDQLLQLVIEENEAVRRQKYEVEIAEQSVTNALSVFEPTLGVEYESSYGHEQNDAALRVQRSSSSTYQYEDRNYKTSIEGLLPTGTEYQLYYEMDDPANSLQTDAEYGHEYDAKTGIKVTQPLLKNFGLDANMANYRVATKEKEIGKQTLRQAKMGRLYEAALAYADLQYSEKRVRNELKLLEIEKKGVDIVAQLAAQGRVDRSAVFQAESDLVRREARVDLAKKVFRRASNSVRRMLVGTTEQTDQVLYAADPLEMMPVIEKLGTKDLDYAYEKRPEFISAKIQNDLEHTRVDYASNQRLPDLDLVMEIGKTGLADNGIEAHHKLGSTYKFWSLGVQLSVPLAGGLKSKSSFDAARLRKKQAELRLHSLEGQIAAEVDMAEYELESTEKTMHKYQRILRTAESSLKELEKKFENGKASRYEILKKQSEVLQAETSYHEKLLDYKKSSLALLLAQGRLLEHYSLGQGNS
ncbi:MAG: TolC family protein [Methylocystaceae bacterium]|nr:TolC family protein [Methylocystaceae bacterium]